MKLKFREKNTKFENSFSSRQWARQALTMLTVEQIDLLDALGDILDAP